MFAQIGLFAVGIVTGVFGGYLGIGGALIITPVLLAVAHAQQIPETVLYPLVFSSTLFAILGTSISAGVTYARAGRVHWGAFRALAISALFLSFAGSWFAVRSAPDTLRTAFGTFALISAALFVSPLKGHDGGEHRFHVWPYVILGAATGFLSAYIGVAGGVLMVPVMLFVIKTPQQYAVGTSSMIGIVTSLAGMTGYVLSGWHAAGLPAGSIGYVYPQYALPVLIGTMIGGPFGSKLNQRGSIRLFRWLFAFYLLIVAVRMLWRV